MVYLQTMGSIFPCFHQLEPQFLALHLTVYMHQSSLLLHPRCVCLFLEAKAFNTSSRTRNDPETKQIIPTNKTADKTKYLLLAKDILHCFDQPNKDHTTHQCTAETHVE